MRSKVFLAVAAAFAVVLTLLLSTRRFSRSSHPAAFATNAANKVHDKVPHAKGLPLAQDVIWRDHIASGFAPSERPFEAFANWTERYTAGSSADAKKAL